MRVCVLQNEKAEAEGQLGELGANRDQVKEELDNQIRVVVQQELEIKTLRESVAEMKEEERLRKSMVKVEREKQRKEDEETQRRQSSAGGSPVGGSGGGGAAAGRERREREKPKTPSVAAPTFSLDAMLRGQITNELSRQRTESLGIRESPDRMDEKVKKTELDLVQYYHFMKETPDKGAAGAGGSIEDTLATEDGAGANSTVKRKPPQQPPPPPRSLLQASGAGDGGESTPEPSQPAQKAWNSISKSRPQAEGSSSDEDSTSESEDSSSMDEGDREARSVTKEAEEVISNSKDVYQKLKELKAQRQQSLSRAQKSLRRLSVKPMSPPVSPSI